MNDTTLCNVCEQPGEFETAAETGRIRCNVRRFGSEAFTIWRCPNCRSLHCKEAVDLDPYYAGYPMRMQKADFATSRAFDNRLRLHLRYGLKPTHSVLDYGSGTSLFVAHLVRKGFDAVGYDPYVPSAADQTTLARKFDVITTQDVIEHVADPTALLVELSGRLEPGGLLFVGTPNASEIEITEEYSMELHPPYHRHILSETALDQLSRKVGFEPIGLHRRFYYDTLIPTVNTQFIRRYVRKAGGFLDAGFEEPRVGLVLGSPELIFYGFFGYFLRARGNMLAVFRKT